MNKKIEIAAGIIVFAAIVFGGAILLATKNNPNNIGPQVAKKGSRQTQTQEKQIVQVPNNNQQEEKKSIVYANSDYGFQLTLPKGWDKYNVTIDNSYTKQGITYLNFNLPTSDNNWKDDNIPSGYATQFSIRVWNLQKWDNLIRDCKKQWGPGCSNEADAIAKSNKFAFDVYYPQAGPSDLNQIPVIALDYLKANLKLTN